MPGRPKGSKDKQPRQKQRKWRWFMIEKRVMVRLYNPETEDVKKIYDLAKKINEKNNK